MSEIFDLDEMVAVAKHLTDLGKNIPIGVRLHPDDFAMLVRECTEPGNPNSLYNLSVHVDATVQRGVPKFMYRDDAPTVETERTR